MPDGGFSKLYIIDSALALVLGKDVGITYTTSDDWLHTDTDGVLTEAQSTFIHFLIGNDGWGANSSLPTTEALG